MKFQSLFALPLLVLALPTHAEPAAQELEYQSVFEGYQAYSDSDIQSWPTVNELVRDIGGWRVYAREPYLEENKATNQPAEALQHNNHGGTQ